MDTFARQQLADLENNLADARAAYQRDIRAREKRIVELEGLLREWRDRGGEVEDDVAILMEHEKDKEMWNALLVHKHCIRDLIERTDKATGEQA